MQNRLSEKAVHDWLGRDDGGPATPRTEALKHMRLISRLVFYDDQSTVAECLRELVTENSKRKRENSVLLFPVIGENEIPDHAKLGASHDQDKDHFIGGVNYNQIFTPDLGSEGVIANLIRNLSSLRQLVDLTGKNPYREQALESPDLKELGLVTDFGGSGKQIIDSVKRLVKGVEDLERQSEHELSTIVVYVHAVTPIAYTKLTELKRELSLSGWTLKIREGQVVRTLWDNWVPGELRRRLIKVLVEASAPRKPKETTLKKEILELVKNDTIEWHDLPRADELAFQFVGLGFGGVAALYLNQLTVPNTLPGFFSYPTNLTGPLFSKRKWALLTVDSSTLIAARPSVGIDEMVRPFLLGTGLTGDNLVGRSVFDFSHFHPVLDMLELANFGVGLESVGFLLGLEEEQIKVALDEAMRLRAIELQSHGQGLQLTDIGSKILATAREELNYLSRMDSSCQSNELAKRAIRTYLGHAPST